MEGKHEVRLAFRKKGGARHHFRGFRPREVQVGKGAGPIEIVVAEEALRATLERRPARVTSWLVGS